ncbi:hypothetical protein HDU97_007814 [Phlyctochytrium planicorne]|nr:hypothetical protein HDU97_007814 [Phlyctochytrium planicorne]
MSSEVPTPTKRGMSSMKAEGDMIMQLRGTIDHLTAVVNDQQAQLQQQQQSRSAGGDSHMVVHPESFESVVSILRKFLDSEQHAHASSDPVFRSALESIDAILTTKISTQRATVTHLQKFIADTEFAWQDHTTVADDDLDQLKQVAWSGWPVLNKVDPNHYHYDFFISYRVSSDSLLARELSLHLVGRGFKVFLDQEELKDGEDWRKGFVRGLKRSKVVLMLVSKGCVQRMVHSNHTVDNVLLEWETAMCAQEMGFCHAVPIFVGTGTLDFAPFPRERAIVADNFDDPYACHQSAFTTLSKVTTLKYRFDHPNPDAGVPPSLVDDIVRELDAFDELHYNMAPQRAHALFARMGASEIFHESSFFDAPELWADPAVKISNVSPKQFDLVRFFIEQNCYWDDFTFEGQADFQVFISLLITVLSTDPSKLTFKRSWKEHELAKVKDLLSSCESIQELCFGDCVINSDILDICENMPSLMGLTFDSCNFDGYHETYEENSQRLAGILGMFEELHRFRFFQSIPIAIDEDNGDLDDELLDTSADMIIQTLASLNTMQILDLANSRIPESAWTHIQTWLQTTTNLETLNLSGQTITDEMVRCLTEGFESNESVTTFVLGGITTTARNLLSLFSAIKDSKIADLRIEGTITDTVGPGPLVQTYRQYIRNSTILKSVFFIVKAEDEDLKGELSYFWEPFFENLFIQELTISDRFVSLDEEFAERLTAMTQLETLTLDALKFRQSDVLEIVEEAENCPSIKALNLNAFCCKKEAFTTVMEAMERRKDLKIVVDWSDDIDAFVRSTVVFQAFSELRGQQGVEFAPPRKNASGTILEFKGEENVQAPAQNDAVVSIHKTILQKASHLETNEKLIHKFGQIKEAVEDIAPYFKKTRTSNIQDYFSLKWPAEMPKASPSVFLLDSVIPPSISGMASVTEDMKIIRELKLRLKTFKLPKKDAWLDVEVSNEDESLWTEEEEYEDEDDEEEDDEDEWDGLLAVEPEDLILGQPYKLVVESLSYSRSESSPSPTMRSVEPGSSGMLPNVVVIFLSESIFENLENDNERFWVAIDAWEYLLHCSDEEMLAVVPVFIATKSSPNEIIGKMKHLLRSSLYVLASKRVRSGGNDLDRLRIDISRAFETIDQLFKLQGMTIEKVQQTKVIADKIMNVASQFLKLREKDRTALSKATKDYYDVVSSGLEASTLDLQEDIVDSNVHALEALLQNAEFKHFFGETGPDSATTNVEGHIVEAWKKAPSLETIYLDGLLSVESGPSRGCTDQAWIELSKFLKKKKLTKFVLKWNMESNKAATQLSEVLATHPTLKILELNGFTDCFAGPLLSSMASNTTITEFTFSATNIDVTLLVGALQNTRVKVLGLKWASYDDDSFKALATWLQSDSCTLEELDIEHNTPQKLPSNIVFFQSIGVNRSLKSLNASGHDFRKNESKDALLGSIQRNTTLKTLILEGSKLSDYDCSRIISAVAACRQYEEINLNENNVGSMTCHQVAEWITGDDCVVKTIKFADTERNEFASDWKQPICGAVLKNRTISELDAGDDEWPEDIALWLQANQYRHLTKSTLEAWEWAIDNKDSSAIQHLRNLPDAEEFMRKEAVKMVCWAARSGNMEVLRYNWVDFSSILTSVTGYESLTPLGHALVNYQVEAIQYLIDRGAKPIAAIPFGSPIPALYRVLGFGDHLKLADIVRQKFNSNPDEKVNERISPDFELRGTTVLHKAAANGYFRAVEYLLPIMQNPGVTDEFGSTALHCAARLIKRPSDLDSDYEFADHIKTIEILKRSGRINVDAKDKKGRGRLSILC